MFSLSRMSARLFLAALLLFPLTSFAQDFSFGGYSGTVTVQSSGDDVWISGYLQQGPRCDFLKIAAYSNDDSGHSANLVAYVASWSGSGSSLFSSMVHKVGTVSTGWRIVTVSVVCQD